MDIGLVDTTVFVLFIAAVVGISIYASRKEDDHEDYFLAGRNLGWWVIGISLITTCLSTEQLVGMNGQAFGSVGLAVAAWALLAAVAVVEDGFPFAVLQLARNACNHNRLGSL